MGESEPPGAGTPPQIADIQAAFEAYDNTGNAAALEPHLAEDVVFMYPGIPPIEGKQAVVEKLRELDATTYDVEQTSDQLMVGDDLIVDRATTSGTKLLSDGSTEELSHKGVDVYRQDPDGSWKVAISIFNDQG